MPDFAVTLRSFMVEEKEENEESEENEENEENEEKRAFALGI